VDECKPLFVGMDYNSNRYVRADKLLKWGFEKHMKVGGRCTFTLP